VVTIGEDDMTEFWVEREAKRNIAPPLYQKKKKKVSCPGGLT